MNLFKKARHYLDPRTHIAAARSAGSRVIAAHQRAFAFQRRVVSRDNIKDVGRNIAVYEAKFMPYVEAAAAFLLSAIFTPLAGIALTAVAAPAAQRTGATAARDDRKGKQKHGNEARQAGRDKRNQSIELGLLGTTAGALTSVAVAALSAPAVAGEVGAAGAAGAPGVVGAAPGLGAAQGAELGAAYGANVAAAPSVGALAGASAGAGGAVGGAGGGLLSGLWSGIKTVGGWVGSVGPTAYSAYEKFLAGRKAEKAATDAAGRGVGGGGAEGTGDVGTDGGLLDQLAGLPGWVKLGAGAVGVGLVYVAFKKGRA